MSSLERIFKLGNLVTTDGEPISNDSAWQIYVEPEKLIDAIGLINKGATDIFPVQIVALNQTYPDPQKASISPVRGTYVDSFDPDANLTAFDIWSSPLAVKATLLQPDPHKDQHVLCIVDKLGCKGLMWFIAQELA